jgi:hypothetical protein
VVQLGAKVVDTDRVDAQHLKECGISSAGFRVGEGILALFRLVSGLATWLIVDTNDLESLAVLIDEIAALDLEGLERRGEGRRQ